MDYKRAGDIQVGDILDRDGNLHRVTGWYVDGRGKMMVEFGGRWHTYNTNDRLRVRTMVT